MFWTAQGAITGANDAFLQMVGYNRDEMAAGHLDWRAMSPPEFADADRRCAAQLAADGVCTPYEKEYIRKDGSRVPIVLGLAAFEDNPDEGVCFVLDLTEKKKLERQFLRAQRMESIGTLAGGIAHDLNNVLTPILMSLDMLRERVTSEGDLGLLDVLETSAKRGASLVKQVLSFARGVDGQSIVVNPVQVMEDLLAVTQDTFPKNIDVSFTPAADLWAVTGDPTQIYQVFVNLCVNARDAMPEGGRLVLSMENIVLDDTYAAMNADARPGPHVVIKISDSGVGIPAEVRDRIFEPFFTTKEIGKGTGLGLSTTVAIVKSHGGFIHLYSEVGNGTTFKVFLPADPGAAVAADPTTLPARLPRGDGELVLVVDDEEPIRKIAKETLENFGYRVLLAANGAEAVAIYAQHRERIAVVLTDMAMPVMDGPTCIIALMAIDPDVRVIGSSGLAANQEVARAVGAGVQHFVPKPYTAEAMLQTLAFVLGAGREA